MLKLKKALVTADPFPAEKAKLCLHHVNKNNK